MIECFLNAFQIEESMKKVEIYVFVFAFESGGAKFAGYNFFKGIVWGRTAQRK